MKIITQNQLQEILSEKNGAQFVTIVARTDARLKKTGNPFAMPVMKTSTVNGAVNWHYGNAVNRQRSREAECEADFELFEPLPRKWGNRLPHSPFVEHKGKLFLEVKVERSLAHRYEDANGNALTDAEVRPFLPAKASAADWQEVDKEILLRDYSLENILELRCGGEVYSVIKPEITAPANVMAGITAAVADKVEPGAQLPLFPAMPGSALIGKLN